MTYQPLSLKLYPMLSPFTSQLLFKSQTDSILVYGAQRGSYSVSISTFSFKFHYQLCSNPQLIQFLVMVGYTLSHLYLHFLFKYHYQLYSNPKPPQFWVGESYSISIFTLQALFKSQTKSNSIYGGSYCVSIFISNFCLILITSMHEQ